MTWRYRDDQWFTLFDDGVVVLMSGNEFSGKTERKAEKKERQKTARDAKTGAQKEVDEDMAQ
jgi:hypothetical protein